MNGRKRAALLSTIVLATAVGSGCAGTAKNVRDGQCLVSPTLMGIEGTSATVAGNRATTQGFGFTREIAELRDDGTILYLGGANQTEAAEVRDGRLVIKMGRTAVSEPISDGTVRVAQGGGERAFSYTSGCTVEQAALGTYALIQSEVEHGGS